jgi:hypothetical protein
MSVASKRQARYRGRQNAERERLRAENAALKARSEGEPSRAPRDDASPLPQCS